MVQVAWLLVLVACVGAFREIEFKNCKSPTGPTGTLYCKVKSVKVNGCLTPSSWVDEDGSVVEYQLGDTKSPCRLDSSSLLNFSISFEPGFSVETLRSHFTLPELSDCRGLVNGLDSQCPLTEPPRPGCDHTKCPLEAGRLQRYESTLQISQKVSNRPVNLRRIYQMKWKLWNNKNKKHSCCFNIPVQY